MVVVASVVTLLGCGYHLRVGAERPAGIPCVHVDGVENRTSEQGLGLPFGRAVQGALDARGWSCTGRSRGVRLELVLETFEVTPAWIGVASSEDWQVGAYRVHAVVACRLLDDDGSGSEWLKFEVERSIPSTGGTSGAQGLADSLAVQAAWDQAVDAVARRVVAGLSALRWSVP